MKDYLKIIFSAALLAATFAIPVRAQNAPPSIAAPTQSDSQPIAAAPVQAAPAQDTPPAQQNGPVQTETVQTDPVQKPSQYKYYSYAHDEAEYSVSLPAAPSVSTIWHESPDTKAFLRQAPTDHAALGEHASFKIVDIDTEELFEVEITFLRATPTFLEGLTDQKIKHMLEKKFSEVALSNANFNASDGTGTLKWATLSGFVLDNHHHPAFYALHYLTGLQSILVIEAKYSIENKTFHDYYDHMVSSITYVQP